MIKALTEEFRAAPESDANCLGTEGRAGRVWIGEGCIFDFEAYEDLWPVRPVRQKFELIANNNKKLLSLDFWTKRNGLHLRWQELNLSSECRIWGHANPSIKRNNVAHCTIDCYVERKTMHVIVIDSIRWAWFPKSLKKRVLSRQSVFDQIKFNFFSKTLLQIIVKILDELWWRNLVETSTFDWQKN
jgi:hypothetical protein